MDSCCYAKITAPFSERAWISLSQPLDLINSMLSLGFSDQGYYQVSITMFSRDTYDSFIPENSPKGIVGKLVILGRLKTFTTNLPSSSMCSVSIYTFEKASLCLRNLPHLYIYPYMERPRALAFYYVLSISRPGSKSFKSPKLVNYNGFDRDFRHRLIKAASRQRCKNSAPINVSHQDHRSIY